MRGKILIALFASILAIFSIIQIYIDYNEERVYLEENSRNEKKPQYAIMVDIDENRLYLLQDQKCIKKYPVSSGKKGWPSPLGRWKIVSKGEWGEGFGGRWMGLNVTWGKYGIHGTSDERAIGHAASHGCIRMFNDDVKELYDIVPFGTPVYIVSGSFGPFGKGFKSLMPGDRGADVLAIQKRLKELGYFKGWESGIYEDDLKTAVHSFEKKNGLPLLNRITKECWLKMGFSEFE